METRQQRLIRQALEHGSKKSEPEHAPEASLRDQSLKHTEADYVPRTLTPHEWEDYYREHGVPTSHKAGPQDRELSPGSSDRPGALWARFIATLKGR